MDRLRPGMGPWGAVALVMMLSSGVVQGEPEGSRVEGLLVDPRAETTTIKILTERPLRFEEKGRVSDSRYILDLPMAIFPAVQALYEFQTGPVRAAYLAEFQGLPHPVTRLTVDLASGVSEPTFRFLDNQIVLLFAAAGVAVAEAIRVQPPLPTLLENSDPSSEQKSKGQPATLVEGARLSLDKAPAYDTAYRILDYPGGDPGWERGCGVDVIIRAYRALGIDLQAEVHEDILLSESYGIVEADWNIDHRRVRNLFVFLARKSASLGLGRGGDWQSGDVVFWSREGISESNHVGILSDRLGSDGFPLVIHHPGEGPPVEEPTLFAWPIRAHIRWP